MFYPILFLDYAEYHSKIFIFNNLFHNSRIHSFLLKSFIICIFPSHLIILYYFISKFIPRKIKENSYNNAPNFGLLVGMDVTGKNVYISEKGLYQNILITGSIGSGKTASAMYPFTKQLINHNANDINKKLCFLILDVKGNYYSKVLDFAHKCNRLKDVIVIQVNGRYKYNPLDKPYLKSSVLANRLKMILLLFSPNNSESYWLDKVEQILECCINLCRIYNHGYVTFSELHKLVVNQSYYRKVIRKIRKTFYSGKLSKEECYLLLSSISFLENDYYSLDSRTYNILKSEITRITNCFIADYEINKTFCPTKSEQNFYGFTEVIDKGKIVVLNMNLSHYKNLSKIIAAYLKLDFQTDVLNQLSNSSTVRRPSVFISDEYQEYVTSSDADFFSQSREAKCINIVSTQSYTSILNSLNNVNSTKVIIQNLVNKLWFRTDDIFTIEEIQKQIGKIEKDKVSRTISENSKESYYSPLNNDFISLNSSISESINTYSQNDFKYDYNFFTQHLNTFSCISFLSNGNQILNPSNINMVPYFYTKSKKGGYYEKKK